MRGVKIAQLWQALRDTLEKLATLGADCRYGLCHAPHRMGDVASSWLRLRRPDPPLEPFFMRSIVPPQAELKAAAK